MHDDNKKLWNIDLESIRDCDHRAKGLCKKWDEAFSCQRQRTKNHDMFSKVAHGMTLFDSAPKGYKFSDGTTQAVKRKIRAQTIQRVPDGEIVTQYDKNSIEQAIIEYLFKHKVLTSEFDGRDMMKNLWKTFNMSFDYGFACVRTGFEKDLDSDPRISYTLVHWYDVYPAPDCRFIEEAPWYFIREYVPFAEIKNLIDWDTETIKDPTYNEDVVKYIIENEIKDGMEPQSAQMQDRHKGHIPSNCVETRTFYRRGADEFITYVPSIQCVLRTVKNYDPRKDVPLHFLILEPDPEFPLGCSSVMWTMAQQQFADAFQSTVYQTLLLSLHPPLMTFGNLANPKIKMRPNAVWPMGTNPQNKIEPYRVETTTLTQFGSILENIGGKMMQSLNITDATVASDAEVARYSATPQGVEQQKLDKTITVNQYQKRVEIFFQEWANHALRSYINSMSGEKQLTVDEHTRRRIWDIENSTASQNPMDMMEPVDTIIEGDKITVDFSKLSSDLLSFEVRSGSLIENEKETERRNIQEMLIPVSQMIGNIGDQNRDAFEHVIMQLVVRLCELSDVDISQATADKINEKLLMAAMEQTMAMNMQQQQQIDQLQQAVGIIPGQQGGMPQQGAPMPMPQEQAPMPQGAPMPQEPVSQGLPMPQEQMPMPQEPMLREQMPMPETPMPEEEGVPMESIPM